MAPMDYCIRAYILSPFDEEAANILKHSIDSNVNKLPEFKSYVMDASEQLKKCVQYIIKFRFDNDKSKENLIINDYERFIEDFYNLIFCNIDKLKELFNQNIVE